MEKTKYFLSKSKDEVLAFEALELKEVMKYHSELYYIKESPIISDKEYDDLYSKLKFIIEKFNLDIEADVWVDISSSTFEKVKHSLPMISLDNTYSADDLKDFDNRLRKFLDEWVEEINYAIEYKFDWLWLELIYEKWEFIQAITRWNWIEWEDVTQNARQISNIPKKISYEGRLEVRGEVVMLNSVFKKTNEERKKAWLQTFSNPRNSASWAMRQKDPKITKDRELVFFAYDIPWFENFDTYSQLLKYANELWFQIWEYFKEFSSIWEVIEETANFKQEFIDYEIDGLVIKALYLEDWKKAWKTQHHPRYSIAYKFPAKIYSTTIISIEHSVWRTWTITPVANLEPVEVSWVTIKRATLHNYEEVEKLWVAPLDRVFLERAWEVIPKITSLAEKVNKEADFIKPPYSCPSCWEVVKKDFDKVRFYCDNPNCPAQIATKLSYSVWKSALNIVWFWESIVERFLKEGIISDLVDIFTLKDKSKEILDLEGFKEKSLQNLLDSIEYSKNMTISTFLIALWISWVWKKTAQNLSILFKDKYDLLSFSHKKEDIEKIEDIWWEIALNLIKFFENKENLNLIERLLNFINIDFQNDLDSQKWKLSGVKICITGSFERHSRDELIKKLEEAWWEFISWVSKKTNYLLAWEKAWSKLKKAQDLWIEVISLDFFLKMI